MTWSSIYIRISNSNRSRFTFNELIQHVHPSSSAVSWMLIVMNRSSKICYSPSSRLQYPSMSLSQRSSPEIASSYCYLFLRQPWQVATNSRRSTTHWPRFTSTATTIQRSSLKENDLYDPLIVGKYCEKRDPNMAYIAYSKGQNDLELINITNENGMYKAQARYLLDRADPEIWAFVPEQ